MSWLARLKKIEIVPESEPAKPEKPGFVSPDMAPMPTTWSDPQAANDPNTDPEPPPDPNAWRELAQAYHAHHFKCSTCIAAGRGDVYGLRCGTGAALWINYQNT